jgi:hypothetical protein
MFKNLKAKLRSGEVVFGLRESIIVGLVGIAISVAAAVYYS